MNPSTSGKKTRPVSEYLPILGFALVLCYFMYGVAIRELTGELSDYSGHVYVYIATFTGESALKGWMMSPYFLWHAVVLFFKTVLKLPVENSAAAASCVFYLASYFITVFMTEKWCSHNELRIPVTLTGFFSFALTMIQPIWISFLDAGASRSVGVFSFNPLYSPTHMAARPFALLCFMLVIDLWELSQSRGSFFFGLSRIKALVVLSVTLFISAAAKPVFAEMFIPAVGIMMLFECIFSFVKNKESGKTYLKEFLLPAFCAAIPAIVFIFAMFFLFINMGGSYTDTEGVVITPFLQVWSIYSENIPLSMLFMMSFPIYILIIDSKNFLRSVAGKLGIISFVTGFLEAAFLGEGGDKLGHGNFIWPMMFGILLLWASAMLHFLTMEKKTSARFARFLICLGWILILIHVHYGFQYLFEVFGWDFMIF
ncbi:MAG: hypothetical protein J6X94_00450 [Lachnospiraceae bacterium]|nr:hypothetical protein [Lachnospiraceae bacterium]